MVRKNTMFFDDLSFLDYFRDSSDFNNIILCHVFWAN